MPKVLMLVNDTTYAFNLRDQVIERLVMEGYEVIVASQPLLHQDGLKKLGARLIDIQTNRHGTNPISDLNLLRKYIRIIRDEKPDVVLTYNIKPNAYGGMACRITKTKYLPNITGLGTAVEIPGIMQKITMKLYKAGIHGAACVFFQNEENRQFFINHKMLRARCKTVLLPGSGVNLDKHKVLGYPEDNETINFLFIARVMKEKGIDLYLKAAKKIHEKYKKTVFHICGYCDDEKYLTLLKNAEDYIEYHGEQKDMIPFFEKAHCIVHPSYYPEGMSNVLLEAAAHARPIIATDRAGCRETVEDGKTGYLIPIQNENALVMAIEKFIQLSCNEKKNMGLEGRKKIEKEFNRQTVAQLYIEEVKKIDKLQENNTK